MHDSGERERHVLQASQQLRAVEEAALPHEAEADDAAENERTGETWNEGVGGRREKAEEDRGRGGKGLEEFVLKGCRKQESKRMRGVDRH
jgi:hypothetical protein